MLGCKSGEGLPKKFTFLPNFGNSAQLSKINVNRPTLQQKLFQYKQSQKFYISDCRAGMSKKVCHHVKITVAVHVQLFPDFARLTPVSVTA